MKNKLYIGFTCLFIILCGFFFLFLLGEGYILVMVHSMMNSTGPEGTFVIEHASSKVMDCAEFHKKFPELATHRNVMTAPIPLNDGSGLFERYVKADKSILDLSDLSWKNKLSIKIASEESHCARSLGTFIEAVVNGVKK